MAKRKKKSSPLAIFWTRRDQTRFIDAVEKLVALVGDLTLLLDKKRRAKPAVKPIQGKLREVGGRLEDENGVPY